MVSSLSFPKKQLFAICLYILAPQNKLFSALGFGVRTGANTYNTTFWEFRKASIWIAIFTFLETADFPHQVQVVTRVSYHWQQHAFCTSQKWQMFFSFSNQPQ